jgi:hypothetical protein
MRTSSKPMFTDRRMAKEFFLATAETQLVEAVFRLCSTFLIEHGSLICRPHFSICDVRAARNPYSHLIGSVYLSLSNFPLRNFDICFGLNF